MKPVKASAPPSGFTLVEVTITIAIVAVAALGIFASILYGVYAQQQTRERNAANREAAAALEKARRTFFPVLTPFSYDTVLDNRGTSATADDVNGRVGFTTFNSAGTSLTVTPPGYPMIEGRATVSWTAAGKKGRQMQPKTVVVKTFLTP